MLVLGETSNLEYGPFVGFVMMMMMMKSCWAFE